MLHTKFHLTMALLLLALIKATNALSLPEIFGSTTTGLVKRKGGKGGSGGGHGGGHQKNETENAAAGLSASSAQAEEVMVIVGGVAVAVGYIL